jgi:hypothetical protein
MLILGKFRGVWVWKEGLKLFILSHLMINLSILEIILRIYTQLNWRYLVIWIKMTTCMKFMWKTSNRLRLRIWLTINYSFKVPLLRRKESQLNVLWWISKLPCKTMMLCLRQAMLLTMNSPSIWSPLTLFQINLSVQFFSPENLMTLTPTF